MEILPFIYLQMKHQRSYLQDLAGNYTKPLEELSQQLKSIGNSKMDLYTGALSTLEILEEIKNQLLQNDHFQPIDYKNWLQENNGYQKIQLSDQSSWTLRLGNTTKQYIHLHPGRHSKDTIRVSAGVLKTAIITLIAANQQVIETIDEKSINEVRITYLNLSPIKWNQTTSQISKIIRLLTTEN